MNKIVPGLNVQWPWSEKIINGEKTIETRSYPLPKAYIGIPIAIIETPGNYGKREGISQARIIGTVVFSECRQYLSKSSWKEDLNFHCVPEDDRNFSWSTKSPKYAWIISQVDKFENILPAPTRKGIIFTKRCAIKVQPS